MKKGWPGIKKAANRLLSQCESGSKLPLKSHSTYDRCTGPGSNCTLTPEYNGGLAITAYHAVSEMAKFVGDDAVASTFYDNFKTAKEEYKALYGNSKNYGVKASASNSGHFPESHIAGYSWANYFCLGPSMDDNFIIKTCEKTRSNQKNGGVRANGE